MMLRNWSPFIYVLLPLAGKFINEAEGVSCRFCQSTNNYNNCISSAGVIECNDVIVNMTHLLLNPHNPSLGKVPAASQFQCFQVNYTTNGVWNYHMGCSFAGSHICEGWKVLSQCVVSNGIDTQLSTVKTNDKPTTKSATSSVTSHGASKSFGGKASTQATKHSPSGSSTTIVSIVVQSNRSSTYSTLSPKITPTPKDSNIRKTPSKASVFSLQLEVLAIFWVVILFWRH